MALGQFGQKLARASRAVIIWHEGQYGQKLVAQALRTAVIMAQRPIRVKVSEGIAGSNHMARRPIRAKVGSEASRTTSYGTKANIARNIAGWKHQSSGKRSGLLVIWAKV
jgi:hypothetical protein